MTESTPWWRPLSRADRWNLLCLVAVPTLLFGVGAAVGQPAIAADNLLQNYPLRVLVGQMFRTGHLPLLDVLSNAGTPLLGAMNAGAFFPLTFLFVFLPNIVAWVLGLIWVYATAGIGLYALARDSQRSSGASLIAALVYAWGGPMVGQMVHLGVIQGYALLPWFVLAHLSLARAWRDESSVSRRERFARVLPGVLGVATLWALTFLTGEPRAIGEAELLTIVLCLGLILMRTPEQASRWRDRVGFVLSAVLAAGWGAMCAAAQLLPAQRFIALSQRHVIDYSFFGLGSLVVRWSTMWFFPSIVGGNGHFGQPRFFTKYNLPEVTIYTTVGALVAVTMYVVSRRRDGHLRLMGGIGVVGLFATWGYYTPLGHLFYAIPLFGNTRLQSRNAVLVALAATMFLAWWLDHLRDVKDESRLRRVVAWLPLTAGLLITSVVMAMPVRVAAFLGAGDHASQAVPLRYGALVAFLIMGALFVAWHRPQPRRWVMAVLILDLVVAFATTATGLAPGAATFEPSRTAALSRLGNEGRFALIDASGKHNALFTTLGFPNLNVFTGLPSVQSYGALIDRRYNDVTQVHTMFQLSACALTSGQFAPLRLHGVAVTSGLLTAPAHEISHHLVWCREARRAVMTRRYFGSTMAVQDVAVLSPKSAILSAGPVFARALNGAGVPFGPRVTGTSAPYEPFLGLDPSPLRSATFTFPHPEQMSGVQFEAPSGVAIASSYATDAVTHTPYLLDTAFQQAFTNGGWQLHATADGVAYFFARHIRPPSWLTSTHNARILSRRESTWGDGWVTLHSSHSVTLVRSMAYIPGWRATAVNTRTGRTTILSVHAQGLIQKVRVPAGTWEVHFHYHAPSIEMGVALSLASSTLLAGFWIYDLRLRRRRH